MAQLQPIISSVPKLELGDEFIIGINGKRVLVQYTSVVATETAYPGARSADPEEIPQNIVIRVKGVKLV